VLDHHIEVGNPADAPMLVPAIKRITVRAGRIPPAVTADRGDVEAAVDDELRAVGVERVAIPASGMLPGRQFLVHPHRREADLKHRSWMTPRPGDWGTTPAGEADVWPVRGAPPSAAQGGSRHPIACGEAGLAQGRAPLPAAGLLLSERPSSLRGDPPRPPSILPEHLERIYANTALATRVVDGIPDRTHR
jgi:hypothetical protein